MVGYKKGKKIIQLFRRTMGDIVTPYRFEFNRESVDAAGTNRWLYSLGYSRVGMLEHYQMKKDPAGIPMMSHYIDHREEGHYYSPVKVAHYALAAWNDHIKGSLDGMADFRRSIDWLLVNAEERGSAVVWPTPTSNPRYDLPTGYVSAIVQGLALSALARSLADRDDQRVRLVMEKAVEFFYRPVSEGGIVADSQFGQIYEEYPCNPPGHVVNGFMFSLNGLWDAAQMGSERALERYRNAVPSLKTLIPFWITKKWSYYDLRFLYLPERVNLATRHYQYLHIDQLNFFSLVERDDVFAVAIRRMEQQMRNPLNWFSAYLNKGRGLIGKTV